MPDFCEAYYQEERRQAIADKRAEHFPICGCCGHYIYPRESFYTLNIIRDEIIVCYDCKQEMDSSVCIVEDVRYGH